MNNKFSVKSLLLITGLLLTSTCMADFMSRQQIANNCQQVSEDLMQLVHRNLTLPCGEPVKLSAKHLELAVDNLRQKQIQHALSQVSNALKILRELDIKTQCSYFRIKTKPYLSSLAQLRNQIQLLERWPT